MIRPLFKNKCQIEVKQLKVNFMVKLLEHKPKKLTRIVNVLLLPFFYKEPILVLNPVEKRNLNVSAQSEKLSIYP